MQTVEAGLSSPALTRADVEALIIRKAWTDEGFKADFLADAKGTIERYTGQSLPAALTITAHAEDETTVHIVVPARPAVADELSDDDLEAISGGVSHDAERARRTQVAGAAAAHAATAAFQAIGAVVGAAVTATVAPALGHRSGW